MPFSHANVIGDPDYVDVDQEEVLDKKVDHTEEVWRERKIDNEQNRNHQ